MLHLYHSTMPAFPWGEFYLLMSETKILDPQMEDGSIPLDPEQLRYYERDARRRVWLVAEDQTFLGFIMLEQKGRCLKELHTGFRAGSGQMRKRVWEFIWRKEREWGTHSIIAIVPAFNHAARHLAIACGFSRQGRLPQSFLQNGIMHDQVLYAITKD